MEPGGFSMSHKQGERKQRKGTHPQGLLSPGLAALRLLRGGFVPGRTRGEAFPFSSS